MRVCGTCGRVILEDDRIFCPACRSVVNSSVEANPYGAGVVHAGSKYVSCCETGGSMSFFRAILTCFRKYADFSGRARRAEYWYFALIYTILVEIFRKLIDAYTDQGMLVALIIVTTVGLTIPMCAVTSRRLHDRGLSGWFQTVPLLFTVLAVIQILFGTSLEASNFSFLLLCSGLITRLAALCAQVFLTVRLAQSGDVGTNEYGRDPLR